MKTGVIFDIKEMAIHDGPGLRTTVFMKGCPLRCRWCHNPEGLDPAPQKIIFGKETRMVGREYTSIELADLLNTQTDILYATGGGFTFSGGEPLMQVPFLGEVIEHLHKSHILLDTSGFGSPENFKQLLPKVDHVYYDIKLVDDEEHRRWTGVSNQAILHNLSVLDKHGPAYTLRFPLIPHATATRSNLNNFFSLVKSLENATSLHILPYNSLAGGKYIAYGKDYTLSDDPCSSELMETAMKFLEPLDIEVVLKRNG